MARSRLILAALGFGCLALVVPTAVKAAPSQSAVTVGAGGAAPATATVTGGPIAGQGDNLSGAPLNPCPPGACESFGITLAAPAGYTAANVITLAVSTAYDNPPNGSGPGTLDTYLEDSKGNVVSGDPNSDNPSKVAAPDAAPGSYTLVVAGSTGADNSYTATVTVTSAPRAATPSAGPAQWAQCTSCPPITFGVPSVVDPIHGVGEPDIAVDRAGHVFVSGPAGTGEQRSLWWGSNDGGATYRVIEPVGTATALIGTPNLPGGGDTDIAFDNQIPQTQYFSDLAALVAERMVKTSNEGASESQTLFPGGKETDRQWLAVWDPPAGTTTTSPATTQPIVYMEYGPAPSTWVKSTDGQSFSKANPSTHFGADGYPSIDQVTGDVFEANYNGSKISLNIGTPNDVAGDLTFLDDSGQPGLITVASGVDNSGDVANFVVSSMDTARNLYVAWVARDNTTPTKRQVFVAAAPANNATPYSQDPAHIPACSVNCWNHWTAPVQVSDALPATGDAVNVFPWIKAGGPGAADTVWYGDQSTLDPSATCTPLSTGCHVWNVFMDQTVFPTDATGAITGAAPTLNLTKVTPHPMDYYDVCLSGTGCVESQGNRNLADFFEVNIDHTGAAEIVYDDMSNNLIQAGTSNALDHAGLPFPTVIRQNGGDGLYAAKVSGPGAAPVTGLTGPAGNARYPMVGGAYLPAMDLTSSSLNLAGTTLTVTMKVADLTQLAAVGQVTGGALEEYVTRWQMGNTVYYAEAALGGSTSNAQFSAGAISSVDLCSVSACRPLVAVYGESPNPAAGQASETGSVSCPAAPSSKNPCTITVNVNVADVGSPAQSSLLESVGAYALSASHPQSGTTNAQAEADNVPLEIGGVCCYNFQAAPAVNTPEAPWTPALLVAGAGLIAVSFVRRRRPRAAHRGAPID